MTRWRAVIPIKLGPDAKSRLADLLSPPERAALCVRMAVHVLGQLKGTGRFAEIAVLSPDRPDWWTGAWVADRGLGLNAELMAWREGQGSSPVLVIHADLPLLSARDVLDLLDAADEHGIALATDRVGEGSNALAIADGRDIAYRFGPASRSLHVAQAPGLPVLATTGLAADLDTPEDAAFLAVRGFAL